MIGSYIIWDTKTGIYDGAYVDGEQAVQRFFDMNRENKDGKWVLVQVVMVKESLADEMFHARKGDTVQ
jgi:hypothetical protein